MSEVLTPSDWRSSILTEFIDLRDSLRDQRIGRGGHDLSQELTGTLDRAIIELVSPMPERVAVVALGGYGRGELSPFSDVDLMLLHDVDDPATLASDLFRPLWDAKLRVGHSVRTLSESAAAAKERFDTQTTLLTSRLVAGDRGLFDSLMDEVATVTRARPLRRYLVAEERERREKTPFLEMAVDVKTGRGGLRTLQGFEWERRREALIGRFSTETRVEEDDAREHLLQIRNALHAVAGRGHNEFSVDLREPAARWLGVDVFEAASRLVGAMQTVDGLAVRRWPEVAGPPKPIARRIWSRLASRPEPLPGERAPTLSELVWMLETGEQGRLAFERLWESGHLKELLPEWETVSGLPQLAPFHEHPVDAHLWRTVAEMRTIVADGGRYRRVADEIGEPGLLLLAAFLHDIGKGHGGRHAEVGAQITRRFCERVGAPEGWRECLELAVRHHLLLAETATRRDLDDQAVIDEVAGTVGGLRQLQILYLLTVADSRATGATMWSEWKATLLRTLFVRCASRFGAEPVSSVGPGTTRVEALAAAEPGREEVMADHLDRMPEDYLRSTSAEDVVWHLDLVESRKGISSVGLRTGNPMETAVVVGEETGSFRRHVAESFAANGIDVLEARMHTRSDGLVVDSFQVRDDRTGQTIGSERWESARNDIEAAAAGQLDTVSKVAARVAAYRSDTAPARKPTVRCAVDSATGDVVVSVRCSDRIGRLAEILTALAGCGLEVRLAKLDSRGDEVVDTFHVRGDMPRHDPEVMAGLEQLIASGIAP